MEVFRVLQVEVIHHSFKRGDLDRTKRINLDIRVYNIDSFRENMLKISGADQVKLTYEQVDKQEYDEVEEVMT